MTKSLIRWFTLPLLAVVLVVSATATYAGTCCGEGKSCCEPGAECCK